jgi:hypothetical protein
MILCFGLRCFGSSTTEPDQFLPNIDQMLEPLWCACMQSAINTSAATKTPRQQHTRSIDSVALIKLVAKMAPLRTNGLWGLLSAFNASSL